MIVPANRLLGWVAAAAVPLAIAATSLPAAFFCTGACTTRAARSRSPGSPIARALAAVQSIC